MEYKESWGTKLIKRFYGITGPLDEYRYQEITRIGNNAFMCLWIYLLVSNMIAAYVGLIYPEITLWSYIGANTFVAIFGIGLYIIFESKKLKLNEIDTEEVDLRKLKNKMIKTTLLGSLFYGTFMFIFNALLNSRFEENIQFKSYLFSRHNIITAVLQTIGFASIMFLVQFYRIRKSSKLEEGSSNE